MMFSQSFHNSKALNFPLTGFVLAGGKSSRMGKDKALIRLHDRYLIHYPIQVLQQLTTDVRIIGDPSRYGFLGLPVVSDCTKSSGPLSGIYTALKTSPSFFNLIVGCDM